MSIKTVTQMTRDIHRPPVHERTGHENTDPTTKAKRDITPLEHLVEPSDRFLLGQDPYDPRCEKMRALRTELLLRGDSSERGSSIAILSPCAGEGRSLLTAELAVSFAQIGRPTLLVDADLRRPQQHLLFGTDNRLGLSHALQYGIAPQLHTMQGLPSLSVLTAGPAVSNPLELLSSNSFVSMIDDWRDRYEFIVIDTAPVKQFSDGLVVANLVGQVLALSRAKHTPYKDMQDMVRRLEATRSEILGAVISHF